MEKDYGESYLYLIHKDKERLEKAVDSCDSNTPSIVGNHQYMIERSYEDKEIDNIKRAKLAKELASLAEKFGTHCKCMKGTS